MTLAVLFEQTTYGDFISENDAPVILWNDGGPGASMLDAIFHHGPFIGNETAGTFQLNPFSWHKKYHMIYLDNPVGVGK